MTTEPMLTPEMLTRLRERAALDPDIAALLSGYYDYDNAITWGVTCLNCASLLDQLYERDAAVVGYAILNENQNGTYVLTKLYGTREAAAEVANALGQTFPDLVKRSVVTVSK